MSWGLPVPDQPGHTFYVWFDALLGLSALLDDGGSVELDRLCGRAGQYCRGSADILRFHAVYGCYAPADCLCLKGFFVMASDP